MGIVALILNILKGITQLTSIFKLIKANKGKMLLISVILSIMLVSLFFMIEEHKNSMPYSIQKNSDNITRYVDSILAKCGHRTGITISAIDTKERSAFNDHWLGRFFIARACDKKERDNNCIVDLKDIHPSLYLVDHKVGINSYELMLRLGGQTLASRFYLRNKEGKQDLKSLSFYPFIRGVVENTNWYKEQILHNLWITSIISRDQKVLYIITFLSAKSMDKSVCFDQDKILNNIKDFIIYQ